MQYGEYLDMNLLYLPSQHIILVLVSSWSVSMSTSFILINHCRGSMVVSLPLRFSVGLDHGQLSNWTILSCFYAASVSRDHPPDTTTEQHEGISVRKLGE